MIFGSHTKVNNSYELLTKERFISVNRVEENSPEWNANFDLQDNRYFGNLKAIDDEATYGGMNKTKDEAFSRYITDYLSIFKYLELSKEEIKESNYVIEKEILPLLNKEDFKEEFPTNFEAHYLNAGLTKVRIEYNKKFLPIKVYGYYDGTEKVEKGWHLLRTISYPYKNKQAFDKALKEYIQLIKEVEEEKEAEREREN